MSANLPYHAEGFFAENLNAYNRSESNRSKVMMLQTDYNHERND